MPNAKKKRIVPKRTKTMTVKHLPGFPTKLEILVEAELMMGPAGGGSIGIPLPDASIRVKDQDDVVHATVEACVGGGLIVRYKEHTYGINMSDIWNSAAVQLPDALDLLVPFRLRSIRYEKLPSRKDS